MTTALVTQKTRHLNERCMNFGMVMTESHFARKAIPYIILMALGLQIQHFECRATTALK